MRQFNIGKMGVLIVESGSMKASWFLDGTYLKIECSLSGKDYTRYYSQHIGFDTKSKK